MQVFSEWTSSYTSLPELPKLAKLYNIHDQLNNLVARQYRSFDNFTSVQVTIRHHFIASITIRAPPRVSIRRRVTRLINARNTSTGLRNMNFTYMFGRGRVNISGGGQRGPENRRNSFLLNSRRRRRRCRQRCNRRYRANGSRL